jgi:hypothetical protein
MERQRRATIDYLSRVTLQYPPGAKPGAKPEADDFRCTRGYFVAAELQITLNKKSYS